VASGICLLLVINGDCRMSAAVVLQAAGYECVEDASDANVIVYNTCSIRDKAEQKVYSALGRQVGRIARAQVHVHTCCGQLG